MRTVGRKWKTVIRDLVRDAKRQGIYGNRKIFAYVKDKLPVECFETWEGAYNEIERLVWDFNQLPTRLDNI